ncbi:hypothetical protein [Pseudomonas putida]|uniref:hypothetical protein n=1 Tax=Pseudomonas putida TaxID=303 RepID=UPI003D058B24
MKSPALEIGKLTKSLSTTSKFKFNTLLALACFSQIALSIYTCDFNWLASFGGLLTIAGLLLIFSQSFLSEYESEVENLHVDSTPDQLVIGGKALGDLVTSREQIVKILDERREAFEKNTATSHATSFLQLAERYYGRTLGS